MRWTADPLYPGSNPGPGFCFSFSYEDIRAILLKLESAIQDSNRVMDVGGLLYHSYRLSNHLFYLLYLLFNTAAIAMRAAKKAAT